MMDMRRLRLITIIGPVGFLLVLEILSVFVLRPALGNNALLRVLIVFAVLALAVVPFAFAVFAIIERQQRTLAQTAEELAHRVKELDAANTTIAVHNRQLDATVAERTRQIESHNRDMTTRVLRAQEEERKRIARELHDETAQSLSSLLIALDLCEASVPEDNVPLRQGFERVRDLARRTLDETRALSHDLRPTILDDVGLVAALQWYADEHEKTFGVPVTVETENVDEDLLTPESEIALFRIAQEALNNSGKYGRATKARVCLRFAGGSVSLIIGDNGIGFDVERVSPPTKSSGLGLYGMRERATLLDGSLTIDSAPGHGTRIVVSVPLTETTAESAELQPAATGGEDR